MWRPCDVRSPLLAVLQGVEHEQHHLQLRATRHLKTVRSTHRRTLVYYLAIYAAIVVSSFLQVRSKVWSSLLGEREAYVLVVPGGAAALMCTA